MAGLFDPNYPSMLQSAADVFDPNKPALLQGRGVEAAQRALEAQRLLEAERAARAISDAKGALTNSKMYTPGSSAWTGAQAFDGWGSAKGIAQQAKGLLRAASGSLGTGLSTLLYSENAEAPELSQQQKDAEVSLENDAARYKDANTYTQRVQDNTRRTVSPVSLLTQPSPEEEAAAEVVVKDANTPPVEQTNVGPVAEAAPATVEQAAAAAAQQQESTRQTVQAGALRGLATGQITRAQMAQEVVQSDAQMTGKQLTPEQSKEAVTQELSAMKGMDNNKLSEYVSYALIAGGLFASFADKSGKAGDAFSQSFNKQLDRNLVQGKAAQEARVEQAKMDQQLQIKQGDWQRVDRGLDIKNMSAENTAEYQDAQVGIGKERVSIARGQLGVAQQNANQGAQGLGLRAQEMSMRQANADRNYDLDVRGMDLREEANSIQAIKAAKSGSGSGVQATGKEAAKIAQDFADSQGIKLDSKAKSTLASQIQQASKNDPEWATNPAKVVARLIQAGGYEPEVDPGIPFVPFTGGGTRVRQKKQQ